MQTALRNKATKECCSRALSWAARCKIYYSTVQGISEREAKALMCLFLLPLPPLSSFPFVILVYICIYIYVRLFLLSSEMASKMIKILGGECFLRSFLLVFPVFQRSLPTGPWNAEISAVHMSACPPLLLKGCVSFLSTPILLHTSLLSFRKMLAEPFFFSLLLNSFLLLRFSL